MILTDEQLPAFRKRVGLEPTDSSRDEDIRAAWMGAQATAEAYCNRKFDRIADWVERFVFEGIYSISLERYPIESITSVVDESGNTYAADVRPFDANAGLVYLGCFRGHTLTVTYTGGYLPYPPDLWLAVLLTFDNVWGAAYVVTTDEALAARAIKSISVPDVGKIDYATDGSGSYSGGVDPVGLLPGSSVALLNPYRREFA